MLTRRQAKLRRVALGEQLVEVSATSIDALSDLSLELVFSFLDTSDLVQASQVCSRWRDLCSSRRLWSSRTFEHHDSAQKEFLGVVRLLRRTHGVVPYTKVTLSIGYTWPPVSISFEDNAETLKIGTSSSLMHLLCLRNLVKDNVKVLRVIENADLLTVAEALVVWEAIASKTSLTALHITMCRNSILHGVTFDWPKRGSLHEFSFSVFNDARFGGRLCRPIRSLLSVHRHQLTRVDISPQDQQGLLNFVPRHLYTLSAVVLPSLIRVLKSAWGLRHLFLDSQLQHCRKPGAPVARRALGILAVAATAWRLLRPVGPGVRPHCSQGPADVAPRQDAERGRGAQHLPTARPAASDDGRSELGAPGAVASHAEAPLLGGPRRRVGAALRLQVGAAAALRDGRLPAAPRPSAWQLPGGARQWRRGREGPSQERPHRATFCGPLLRGVPCGSCDLA
ncbi:uncharacterized protein LOC117646978 isoform X3 [Thrips palmi]|uniref:Uncharacterized protein LOC117646978 isoform X3 n=1 Tax=Thrips palmi TaxID=161013 RepID=A0A6P8ZAS4_THRPL|nr:uncharacterized protein LOC117646978 isoform X3 [Thrips palmi]